MELQKKSDLEEDSYRISRQYFMQKEGRLSLSKKVISLKHPPPEEGRTGAS